MAEVSPAEDQNPQPENEALEFHTVNEAEEKSVELYTASKAVQPGTEELANKCHISKTSRPSKCEELCTDINNKDCISSKAMDGEHFQAGYNYVLVDEILQQDFQCSICHLIPSTPAKVSCCGNIFCYACITSHQSRQSNCPLCRESTFEFMIDKLQKRKIQALCVRCVNHEKGCEWTGGLREMQQHLQRVNTDDIKKCQYQLTTCKKCDKELMYKELSHHIDNVCEQRVVDCDYNNAGCNFKTTQANMLKHIREEAAAHLQLSLKQMRKDNQQHLQLSLNQMRKEYQDKYWITLVAFAIMAMFVLFLFGSLMFINSREREQIKILQVNVLQQKDDLSLAVNNLCLEFTDDSKRITEAIEILQNLIRLNERDQEREIAILQVEIANLRSTVNELRSELTDNSREFTTRMTENHEAIELQIIQNERDQKREISILQVEVANLRSTVNELSSGFTKYIDDTIKSAIKSVRNFFTPRIPWLASS